MSRGNISAVAIRHPVPPIVLFMILIFAGIVSFLTMDVAQDPDIDFPVVNVSVSRPGAAPSELETQVTKKVEDAVASITGIDKISSTVTDGSTNTTIEFKIGYDTDRAVNDVRDAVSRIRSDLPQDIYEPQVRRLDVTGDAILYYSVASQVRSVEELSWLVDNEITRAIQRVRGVGEIERRGGLEREIKVKLDPVRLMALGVTADEVNAQLRSLNVDLPGGRGNVGASEQAIRTLGAAHTVEDLRNTEIAISGGRKVRLSELGEVVDGTTEMRSIARLNGEPAVTFAIKRAPGSSEVTVADGIAEVIEQLKKEHPDVRFELIIDLVKFTRASFMASIEALIIGAALAVAVVWWFLRDARATMISALAMPLSTIPTFLAMQWLGFSLNGITLLALALVVGILVDDAIVEIENIVRHIRMGKRPYAAAMEAADEIGLAVVATTMTIVVVFLPVSFMPGIPGQFFKSFGITVAVSVLFSLAVARLITPMMAAYLLKPHQGAEHGPGPWSHRYLGLLDWCLRNRWKTAGLTGLIFVGSVLPILLIPSTFVPNQDIGFSILSVELPPGATLAETDAAVQRAGGLLKDRPEVAGVWTSAGRGGQVRQAQIIVMLKDAAERELSQKEFETEVQPLFAQVPGARVYFQAQGPGGGGRDISIALTGNDGEQLDRHAETVAAELRTLPFVANVTTTAALQRPEILIRPLFDRAAEQGVSVAAIGQVARIATLGDIDSNTAKFNLGDRQIPIRVQLAPEYRADLEMIENLRVRTSSGTTVPLKSVAEIGLGSGPVQIQRYDRARRVSVQADLRGMEFGDAMRIINALPSLAHLPPGISKPPVGGAEQMAILFQGFAVALGTALALIVAVLLLLFRNFFQPPTILMALPLSLGGALGALLICGMSISLSSLIGILMLMGIVTKNSILLVEYAIVSIRDHGLDRHAALLDAGAKRARPIIMTSIAMIAGMAPIAIGWGADTEFRQPMAVAVIGGLITSTLLSLIVVPVAFTFMDDLQHRIGPLFSRFLTPKEEPELPRLRPVGGDD
ncbi:efflux RND transporter permease subunit [Rhodocista pekingensis]|uniref:Efflux RND transporter permease subunit n=1 Tax=Rhodocista pekingensis TaxID=201185 RepID=A0ABW2KVU4_9PROT